MISDELEQLVLENAFRVGETWARERASRDELNRLSLFGNFLCDLDPNVEDSLEQILNRWVGFDIAMAAVRLINPDQGNDEASARTYWQQIAGEWLSDVKKADLVVCFLLGGIEVARERNSLTLESLRSGEPGQSGVRAPKGLHPDRAQRRRIGEKAE